MISRRRSVRSWRATLLFALAAVSLLLVSACDSVVSNRPIGERPKTIGRAERRAWEGVWVLPGDGSESDWVFTVRVVDGENGLLKIGSLCPAYESYKTLDVVVRETGGHLYANITDAEGYQWFKIVAMPRSVLIWFPRAERFEDAVNSGILPGFVTRGAWSKTVYLGDLTDRHLALIEADDSYFEGPLALSKVGGRGEPNVD